MKGAGEVHCDLGSFSMTDNSEKEGFWCSIVFAVLVNCAGEYGFNVSEVLLKNQVSVPDKGEAVV